MKYSFSVADKINIIIKNKSANSNFKKFINKAYSCFFNTVKNPVYSIEIIIEKIKYPSNKKLGDDISLLKDGIQLSSNHIFIKKKNKFKIIVPEKVKRGRIPWLRKTPGRHITDEIIEPFLQILLRSIGLTFLHASCILNENKADVFMGWRKSGKTNLIIEKKNKKDILSDDLIILSEDGYVYPYCRPIRIYSYNIRKINFKVDKSKLFIKSIFTPPWQPVDYISLHKPDKKRFKLEKINIVNNKLEKTNLPEFAELVMNFEQSFFYNENLFINYFFDIKNMSVKDIVTKSLRK